MENANTSHTGKGEEENTSTTQSSVSSPPPTISSSRIRTFSEPQHVPNHHHAANGSSSAGPFRGTFQRAPPPSPLRTPFTTNNMSMNGHHTRGKSSSTHSPSNLYPPPTPPLMNTSHSAPEVQKIANGHRRIHSRNLSIFFPRPGSLPNTGTIAEDGSQELSMPLDDETATSSVGMGNSQSSRRSGPITPLGHGFTFGSRPPASSTAASSSSSEITGTPVRTMSSSTTARRGHHHKHSLSHNFFSFLEPTVGDGSITSSNSSSSTSLETELHTQPTPTPISPWSSTAVATISDGTAKPFPSAPKPLGYTPLSLAASLFQFTLGASLWVRGQRIGSLACTGLGYWVVFDAFGVALSEVVPVWLDSGHKNGREKLRRPYG